jgi:hypothetical protein
MTKGEKMIWAAEYARALTAYDVPFDAFKKWNRAVDVANEGGDVRQYYERHVARWASWRAGLAVLRLRQAIEEGGLASVECGITETTTSEDMALEMLSDDGPWPEQSLAAEEKTEGKTEE